MTRPSSTKSFWYVLHLAQSRKGTEGAATAAEDQMSALRAD